VPVKPDNGDRPAMGRAGRLGGGTLDGRWGPGVEWPHSVTMSATAGEATPLRAVPRPAWARSGAERRVAGGWLTERACGHIGRMIVLSGTGLTVA